MDKTYCIFEVYDYKGGELHSSVNLTHERFITRLAEIFENTIYDWRSEKGIKRGVKIDKVLDETDHFVEVKEVLTKAMKSGDFYSIYAGGDGFCGNCYVVENNR